MFINASLAVILVMTRFLLNVFSILNAIDFFPNFRLYIFYLQNNAIFKNVFFAKKNIKNKNLFQL